MPKKRQSRKVSLKSDGENVRDRDRERAQARAGGKGSKTKDDGLTPEQRRERDAKALQEKAAKKAAQAAAGGNNAGGGNLCVSFRVFQSLCLCRLKINKLLRIHTMVQLMRMNTFGHKKLCVAPCSRKSLSLSISCSQHDEPNGRAVMYRCLVVWVQDSKKRVELETVSSISVADRIVGQPISRSVGVPLVLIWFGVLRGSWSSECPMFVLDAWLA
ncbi:hypothetical protein J1N35_000434 [Gossypium stocksii]|uniref:Small EDRK-rich factor-like N-terminal domain-containing protein n=1 Tax=Gossypium stocksii TaxID=47602 RepID=A0A9D3WHG4_9ROSI|nr:hypothetical protein J1N35_000434 [Gossypium stocksii]